MSGGLINHPFLKNNNHVISICTKTVGLTVFYGKWSTRILVMDVVGVDTKHENEGRENKWEREEESRVTIPLSRFYRGVGGDVLFISHDVADIHNNAIRGYKWTSVGFVFTKMQSKVTNGPQILYCWPQRYVIGPWTRQWGSQHIMHPQQTSWIID